MSARPASTPPQVVGLTIWRARLSAVAAPRAQVLELYKAPLRVEGWDSALIEITRQRREACQGDLASYYGMLQPLPALIITGERL